jgi:hypothetical protein
MFIVGILKVNDENNRIWIQIHSSENGVADPELHQNVMDPQYCFGTLECSEHIFIPILMNLD